MARVTKIVITNYKSIKEIEIPLESSADSKFFAFLGVNETGKTSTLEAVQLPSETGPFDYEDLCFEPAQTEEESIYVEYYLNLSEDELMHAKNLNEEKDSEKTEIPNENIDTEETPAEVEDEKFEVIDEDFIYIFEIDKNSTSSYEIQVLRGDDRVVVPKAVGDYIQSLIPTVEFWKGKETQIIPDEITSTSIQQKENVPFENCLLIAGLNSTSISDAAKNGRKLKDIEENLTKKVTDYVNAKWPGHNVTIDFHVSETKVTCSIIDETNPKKNRIKPSARSDGFKKMISFLLSLSVDHENEEISNSILLLDEPERFLHPEAQQHFRNELIKIASKNENSVLIATHSMYMIGKSHIDSCFAVSKKKPVNSEPFQTKIERIGPTKMTYAQINYSIFNIPSIEYHNELYGYLHQKYIESQEEPDWSIPSFDTNGFEKDIKQDKPWKRKLKSGKTIEENLSLHSYIRNCIHHPENDLGNKPFTDAELKKSIKYMHDLKERKSKVI